MTVSSSCLRPFIVVDVSLDAMPLPGQVREDFERLVSHAVKITRAYSSAVFLPTDLLRSDPHYTAQVVPPTRGPSAHLQPSAQPGIDPTNEHRSVSIDLVAVHSHARVVRDARIPVGASVLGWVAEHGRSIHLNPCELHSSAFGIYSDPQAIRSLIAVPIRTTRGNGSPGEYPALQRYGVLVCDSLKVDSFTNADVNLLEEIAQLGHRLIVRALLGAERTQGEASWDDFKNRAQTLGDAIGGNSLELLRMRIDSFSDLESIAGLSAAVQVSDQFLRLAQQALPPHFPMTRLPNGDIVIAVDNMMSAFFRQKLETLANHLHSPEKPLRVTIANFRVHATASGQPDLESVFRHNSLLSNSSVVGGTRA